MKVWFLLFVFPLYMYSQDLSYFYSDGNQNLWTIEHLNIIYKPITKAQSSSGMYSGGTPFTDVLTQEQYTELIKLLQIGIDAKSSQIEQRNMGSAMIIQQEKGEKEKKYILAMNAPEKKAIDVWFKAFIEHRIPCQIIQYRNPNTMKKTSSKDVVEEKYCLLSLCDLDPKYKARTTTSFLWNKVKVNRMFDVIKVFENLEEAQQYSKTHEIVMVENP